MKKNVINLIYILMSLNLFACNPDNKKNNLDFEWEPGINAPKYYPINTLFGSFTTNNKFCSIASDLFQNGGWGLPGGEMSSAKFIPDTLIIGWFSFAEDKFFKGEFPLPVDTMRALFEQGFYDQDGRYFPYDNLIVNVYPKGGVALWMGVGGRRQVEIAHFQGEEMEYDWKWMYPDMVEERSVFIKWVMDDIEGGPEYLAKHGISQEPFKTIYRQRYNYTFEIDSVKHSETVFIYPDFYNGEKDCMEGKDLDNNLFKTKAIPNHVYFCWLKNNIVYFGEIYFDEDEIFKAFAEMSNAAPNEPFVMLLKPDFATRKLHITLRSATREIEIKKYGVIGKSSDQDAAQK